MNKVEHLENLTLFYPLRKGDYIDIRDGKYIHVDKYGNPRVERKEDE